MFCIQKQPVCCILPQKITKKKLWQNVYFIHNHILVVILRKTTNPKKSTPPSLQTLYVFYILEVQSFIYEKNAFCFLLRSMHPHYFATTGRCHQ